MIYMLEDDESIRHFVLYALKNTGFEAEGFELPSEFKAGVRQKSPDLVLLDIMLPEESGLEVLKWIKQTPDGSEIPVIMLTAKGSEYDKVSGLDLGADDYVSKPFGTMELISRIKAVLRRSQKTEKTVITIGDITVDTEKHTVLAKGKEVVLTVKEFELLYLIMSSPKTVFTRDIILQKIWGYSFDGESRTVDVHIKTLRSKLGEAAEIIETVRGVGYRIGG